MATKNRDVAKIDRRRAAADEVDDLIAELQEVIRELDRKMREVLHHQQKMAAINHAIQAALHRS